MQSAVTPSTSELQSSAARFARAWTARMSMDDRLRLSVDSLWTNRPAAFAARRPHPDHRFTHTHRRDLPTPSSPHMPLDLFFFKSQAASGYLRITLRVLYKRVTPYIPFKSCVTLTRETPNSAAIAMRWRCSSNWARYSTRECRFYVPLDLRPQPLSCKAVLVSPAPSLRPLACALRLRGVCALRTVLKPWLA